MKDKDLIKRSDGIEYYRKKKEVNYNGNITLRARKEQIENLKKIALAKDTPYQTLIRDVLDDFINNNKRYLKED